MSRYHKLREKKVMQFEKKENIYVLYAKLQMLKMAACKDKTHRRSDIFLLLHHKQAVICST